MYVVCRGAGTFLPATKTNAEPFARPVALSGTITISCTSTPVDANVEVSQAWLAPSLRLPDITTRYGRGHTVVITMIINMQMKSGVGGGLRLLPTNSFTRSSDDAALAAEAPKNPRAVNLSPNTNG